MSLLSRPWPGRARLRFFLADDFREMPGVAQRLGLGQQQREFKIRRRFDLIIPFAWWPNGITRRDFAGRQFEFFQMNGWIVSRIFFQQLGASAGSRGNFF